MEAHSQHSWEISRERRQCPSREGRRKSREQVGRPQSMMGTYHSRCNSRQSSSPNSVLPLEYGKHWIVWLINQWVNPWTTEEELWDCFSTSWCRAVADTVGPSHLAPPSLAAASQALFIQGCWGSCSTSCFPDEAPEEMYWAGPESSLLRAQEDLHSLLWRRREPLTHGDMSSRGWAFTSPVPPQT